jgi:hypothetical protein
MRTFEELIRKYFEMQEFLDNDDKITVCHRAIIESMMDTIKWVVEYSKNLDYKGDFD